MDTANMKISYLMLVVVVGLVDVVLVENNRTLKRRLTGFHDCEQGEIVGRPIYE
jgi:hypothetical protein